MKLIALIALLTFTSIRSNAQMLDTARYNRDERLMRHAGAKLIKANNLHTAGTIISIAGAAAAVAGAGTQTKGLIVIGGAMGITGFIFNLSAWSWISKAGISLSKAGVAVDLHK